MHHSLRATRQNLHGRFSPDLKPALEIDSGDTVTFECLDAGWGIEPNNGKTHIRKTFNGREPVLDNGHALTGPVFIRGAKPGMTLAVHIEDIQLGDWGTTFAGGWKCDWNDKLNVSDHGVFHTWTFDREAGTATNQHGHTVKVRPFMGIYSMPPAEPGVHSTIPPRRTGGNIDCKELTVGTTLYLPIEVEGGLFSTGDGHAVQGDGEICITAIEAPMERVQIRFEVVSIPNLDFPIARTPTAWVALAFHEDLDEAVHLALESMLKLMAREYGLARLDALALASLVVDFRITQVVNGVKGVHAVLAHDAITYAGRTSSSQSQP